MKPGFKAAFLLVAAALFGVLFFLTFHSVQNSYVPLFSSERMQTVDIKEIKSYLDSANIPYQVQGNQLFVPKDLEYKTRMEMALYGLPRAQSSKGFELFDNTTWIKGEKELQILEVRALIGQLEQDIAQFDNIRSANVVLDIPSTRPFGQLQGKTKASVILHLWPGARLSAQEVRAITYHIAGAVRGLAPNMIAISDTSGKLYQSIDPDGEIDLVRHSELALEEHLKSKVDGLLNNTVGPGNFYTTVQVLMSREKILEDRKIYSGTVDGSNLGTPVVQSISESASKDIQPENASPLAILGRPFTQRIQEGDSRVELTRQMAVPVNQMHIQQNPGKVENISIGVVLNSSAVPESVQARLRSNLDNQLRVILEGYDVKAKNAISFTPFVNQFPEGTNPPPLAIDETVVKESPSFYKTAWILVALALLGLLFWMSFSKETSVNEEEKETAPNLEKILDDLREQVRHKKPANPSQEKSFTFLLAHTETQELVQILQDQTPQTVALLFLYVQPLRAFQILTTLPEYKREAILSQIESLSQMDVSVQKAILERVKQIFDNETPMDAKLIAAELRTLLHQNTNPENNG